MKRNLFPIFLLLAVFFSGSAATGKSSGPGYPESDAEVLPPLPERDYSWMENIRKEHPRMFLTVDDIPQIRKTAETFENGTYLSMKKRIDDLIGSPVTFPDSLAATGESNRNHEWGYRASEAAMLYLITGDPVYLVFTKYVLRELTAYYQLRIDNNLNISWYVFSQICALCAYDWIYNDLSEDERDGLGQSLYRAMYGIAWHGGGVRKARFRENVSDFRSGCYGPAVLPWYLGLTFYGDGVDDGACREMVMKGYDLHQKMVAFRASMIGEKGGGVTACAQYTLGYYPYAEYDFIYTFMSATGIDITEKMDYLLGLLTYMDWVMLPGNREYGFGDVHHYNCLLPHRDMNAHLSELANLFGPTHPEIIPVVQRMGKSLTERRPYDGIPFLRLLHKFDPGAMKTKASARNVTAEQSIYFDTMGQLYMRSGTGEDDTYALFVSGGVPTQHKHYDNNNFIVYKHGYRAVDSGTRPEPGLHLTHYYCRTVAHNCITIRMPGEQFPEYWGGPAANEPKDVPIPNDGGQRELLASKIMQYDETPEYVYIASDATGSYHEDKARLVMREFIWFKPDLFLVFDRVESTRAEYPKAWLFHTVAEPEMITDMEWRETSDGGATVCRTLFPEDAVLEKIGGEGKDFWSDGRNWPLPVLTPDDYGYSKRHIIPPPDHPQIGHWRVEVKPGKPSGKDYFMNIFQVGDTSLKRLPETPVFEDESSMGVSFVYGKHRYTVTFDKDKDYGCDIKTERK